MFNHPIMSLGWLALIGVVFGANAAAMELTAKNLVFDLPGEWKTQTENETVLAVKADNKNNAQQRSFVVSVFKPTSPIHSAKLTGSMTAYLKDVGGTHSGMTLSKELDTKKLRGNVPLSIITYLKDSQFFIGGVLSAPSGVALITYEGTGDAVTGRKEFDKIMQTLSIK